MCAAMRALDKMLTRLWQGKVVWKKLSAVGSAEGTWVAFEATCGTRRNDTRSVPETLAAALAQSPQRRPSRRGFVLRVCRRVLTLLSDLIKAKQHGITADEGFRVCFNAAGASCIVNDPFIVLITDVNHGKPAASR